MKFAADFDSFLRTEVNLDSKRIDRLQQSVGALDSFIAGHADFSEIFLDTIPAGSWAHRTIIKPVGEYDEFDADLLVYVTEQPGWQPKDYIEKLYSAFRSKATYKDKVIRKTRCVRIDYAGDFHVDLVPYTERAGTHYITNRSEPENEGRFEASNPERFSEWIDERQRAANGHFVKVVRLVKYLRDYKNTFTCKSIILMTLLGNEVNPIETSLNPNLFPDVPTTLTVLLERLAASLPPEMPAVLDPAETGDNFTDRYKEGWNYENFRSKVVYYSEKARAALDESDRETSIKLWQDIFGAGFKPGILKKSAELAPLSAAVPWAQEQFIDQAPTSFPMALYPKATVRISGRCTGLQVGTFQRKQGFRQFDLAKSGNRVPKNRSIRFTATTNVAAPFDLYWKVRNGGEEAAQSASGLRGEITKAAPGVMTKTENTLYKGTHYVECYIVSNGRVVARDRQTVIVT
jgi:hypothetical protein